MTTELRLLGFNLTALDEKDCKEEEPSGLSEKRTPMKFVPRYRRRFPVSLELMAARIHLIAANSWINC
jgi:hypothetical protein